MALRGIVWVILILLVAGPLLFFRSRTGDDEILYYSPVEYVERVDELIRLGHLEAECNGADTRIRLAETAPEEIERWAQGSYLNLDMTRFNNQPESFGWYFDVDSNCQLLAIDRTIHTIELPFARHARWLGWIFYADQGSDAQLRSIHRVLSFVTPERPIEAKDMERTWVGSSESLQSDYLRLLFPPGISQPAGHAYMVGDRLVFSHRRKEGTGVTAKLMGYPMPNGAAWLQTGDWLHLSRNDRAETFVYTGGESLEAASLVRLQNDRPRRANRDHGLGWQEGLDPEEPRPFVASVAAGLDAALGVLPYDEAVAQSESYDLQLTVRRDLQETLQVRLQKYARSIARNREPVFPAGITVMDGRSGDLLALATYPTPEVLSQGLVTDARIRQRLLQNQNLRRHPIGSAGKPFLFAAAAEAHPALLDLVLDTHPPEDRHEELFQCKLASGYQLLGGHVGPIGFEKALEVSCNKFTAEMATLALAMERERARDEIPRDAQLPWPRPGRRSGVSLGGRELTWAPALGNVLADIEPLDRVEPNRVEPENGAVVQCDGLARLEQTDFAQHLGRLTRAETVLGRVPTGGGVEKEQFYRSYVTQRYDLRPWKSLITRVRGERGEDDPLVWQQRVYLREVAPERVNLAFNTVTQLRQEWVSLLLGGATSIWTNVQLAEAASRLVTGREVEARLVRVVERDPSEGPSEAPEEGAEDAEPELPPELGFHTEVRQAVLSGMGRVVEGGQGTAREHLLAPLGALRRGDPEHDYWLFSKTGSPVVVRPVHPRLGPALDALVPEHLILDDNRWVRFKSEPAVSWAAQPGESRRLFHRKLQRTLRERGFGRFGLAGAVLRLIDDFQQDLSALTWKTPEELPADIPGPLYVVGTSLRINTDDSLFTQRLAKGKGSVYFLTLVRLPKGAPTRVPSVEQLADPRARVLTAAFYLDFGPDSERAVLLAKDVFPILTALLEEVGAPRPTPPQPPPPPAPR